MNADCDASEAAVHKINGTDLGQVERDRNTAALYTVVCYALDNLPPQDAPVPATEERRRLVLLFGGGHVPEIQEIATAANVPITAYTTEETQKKVSMQLVIAHLTGAVQGLLGFVTKPTKV